MRRSVARAGARIGNLARYSREAWRWIGRQFLPPRLFVDAGWYARRYLGESRIDPFRHYMEDGWKRDYQPNPFFAAAWYRQKYGCAGNPLLHYIRRGPRNPHPLFEARWYLARYPDVAAHGVDPLLHFLQFGRREGRGPHPLFDVEWYVARYGAQGAGDDPFRHYLEEGAAARLDPHPAFDARWYAENNPDVGADRCALAHFVEEGALAGRSPHPFFDADWYLRAYPDIRLAKVNPLVHYLQCGATELRDPHPHFQTRWYCDAWPDAKQTNALTHFLTRADHATAKPNAVFDAPWYARKYSRLMRKGETPFAHFLRIGRFAGLQPGPFFDPRARRNAPHAADPTAAILNEARHGREIDGVAKGRGLLAPLVVAPVASQSLAAPMRIAVHLHAYYPDLAPRLLSALAAIPVPFDLFVTTADDANRDTLTRLASRLPGREGLDIKVTPNRGRDIAPFIVGCGEALAVYDLILHLHTKKSPHNAELSGWLDYLLENLLGAPENVAGVIEHFRKTPECGILYPATYAPVRRFMRLGGNAAPLQSILARLGMRMEELDPLIHASFPSGSMLWMRGAVMERLTQLGLGFEDFPPEAGQDDGTIAHAIERLFPLFALRANLDAVPFIRGDGACDEAGGWRASALAGCDVAILDHDIGGGASTFLESLVPAYLEEKRAVMRIYRDRALGRLIYQQMRDGATRYFIAPEGETLGQALRRCRPREALINSLYGADGEIGGAIAALAELKDRAGLVVRLMVHDFHLACPSQHLLDQAQGYCGLPAVDTPACRRCVRENENIDAAWRGSFRLTTWRLQSQALIDLCDEVRFFDPSGAEILSRVLEIPPHKSSLAPHIRPMTLRRVTIRNAEKLTIGVPGTLTHAKGVDAVNALAHYMREQNLDGEIVVIGEARAAVHPDVRVHGAYQVGMLPDIVESCGVNVILIATIVPETFCYTLSEAMEMQMPIVAFDLGAQGNRLRSYARGMLAPAAASAPELYDLLSRCRSRHAAACAGA